MLEVDPVKNIVGKEASQIRDMVDRLHEEMDSIEYCVLTSRWRLFIHCEHREATLHAHPPLS